MSGETRPLNWEAMNARGFNGPGEGYLCKCGACGEMFSGHKRRVRCAVCASAVEPEGSSQTPCQSVGEGAQACAESAAKPTEPNHPTPSQGRAPVETDRSTHSTTTTEA